MDGKWGLDIDIYLIIYPTYTLILWIYYTAILNDVIFDDVSAAIFNPP